MSSFFVVKHDINSTNHVILRSFIILSEHNKNQYEGEIQKTAEHTNLEVLRRYIRDGDMFRENASNKLGL